MNCYKWYELWLMSVHDYVSRQTVVAVVLCQQVSWSDNEFLLCIASLIKRIILLLSWLHDSFLIVGYSGNNILFIL